MIDDFLFCDWDEAPEAMGFELEYEAALERCAFLVEALKGGGGPADRSTWPLALELYLLAPAIPNVILNYRVCVDLGLPLHPTRYFEVHSASRGSVAYPEGLSDEARLLFARALDLGRAAYRLDPNFRAKAEAFGSELPRGLGAFVYSSKPDKYTWRGAEPAKVEALAASVLKVGRPALALGAAHGSIMAGLLLAEFLGCELWFLRFSMFKRQDREPVVCSGDAALIAAQAQGPGLLAFDEDSASGQTLAILVGTVRSILPSARSGVVIRHASSSFIPDHVGVTWWD